MEEGQFQKIQGWFETLDHKVEGIQGDLSEVREDLSEVRGTMVTRQQFENRFQALLTAMTNLHQRVESYKDQNDLEIVIIKHALHDMETQVKQLQQRVFGS